MRIINPSLRLPEIACKMDSSSYFAAASLANYKVLLAAGNVELVKLLIKRKADVLSKNKAGKSAEELAKHTETKQALQEAMQHAQQEKDFAHQKIKDSHQEPATAQEFTDDEKSTDIQAAPVAIGPQERPSDTAQQEGGQGSKQDLTDLASRKRTSDVVESDQPSPVTLADRPSKAQKVALSFAEDEEDQRQAHRTSQ